MLETLLAVVLGAAAVYWVYLKTQQRAAQSARGRRWLIVRTSAGALVGLAVGVVLPQFVGETPGSPASLVVLLVLWVVGGVLLTLSAAALAGAYRAKPPDLQR
jgi:membrane protease YdiL (CAAX protease family)